MDDSTLRDLGVGLYLCDGTRTEEAIAPRDLALNVQLPELKTLPRPLRKVLGAVYEQFDHSHWREGFEEACQVVATHSAKYLNDGLASGRIVLITPKGRPRNLTRAAVEKMTLGTLAVTFSQIQNPNYSDDRIAKVLKSVNVDRISVAHYKGKAANEERLRKNVGKHMWSLVAVLKELLGTR